MIFEAGRRVHIVGVGGAGMSGVARLLLGCGCLVSGSDATSSAVTRSLRDEGVEVSIGDGTAFAASAEIVLWSPAVSPEHPELVAARRGGARLVTRAVFLDELARVRPVVGITGTHGKTTATSMSAHVFAAAGRDAGRLLGAPVLGLGENGWWGRDEMIVEVDESYGTFTRLHPTALGLLNVEADHLDHYGSLDALEAAFASLVSRTTGPVVYDADDAGAHRVGQGHQGAISVGERAGTWRIEACELGRDGAHWRLRGPRDRAFALALRVTGRHNIHNASVVALLALELELDVEDVAAGLLAFQGAPRRFQRRGRWRGADVYEDYAHLPGEIAATIAAAHEAGYERIVTVFQPHRFTRTQNLVDEFAKAFAGVQAVVVTDIYGAGEPNPLGLTGAIVAEAIARVEGATPVTYAEHLTDVPDILDAMDREPDAIFFLGAGDVATVVSDLPGGWDQ